MVGFIFSLYFPIVIGRSSLEKQINSLNQETPHRRTNALVFISHDTRDAEIAEAFSRLLSSVSAGVLKSFRSSDKKGNQGIEYGVEWYPEIMKKLEASSDVVCLLTPNSINRPWILFEAGVAKGKLDTPVHGIALGIRLNIAATGPFAQFQNLDDDVDSLTALVIQLVRRIPNSEPDHEVVKTQVEAFKQKIAAFLERKNEIDVKEEENEDSSVAKIFEEIKVMFQDLPARIEKRIDPNSPIARRRNRRVHPRMLDEIIHMSSKESGGNISILIVASFLKEDFPWIYELALETYRKLESGHPGAFENLSQFIRIFERITHGPLLWEMGTRSKDQMFELEELMMHSRHLLGRTLERQRRTSKSGSMDDSEIGQE
ncbi:toll/interleukin-1 receptor domain-containing protein [Pectobacterium carotovorum subsp. carotovorum]|nr:toll/interleukin-1 receptor domain-containing protein [Pectobacterium carotovorum subsp. carotovorum]MCL6343509.1 toll/interleukin-1 receptor domain-containing protein [Pectobacterium carotovorum subsp. carotovorum]